MEKRLERIPFVIDTFPLSFLSSPFPSGIYLLATLFRARIHIHLEHPNKKEEERHVGIFLTTLE